MRLPISLALVAMTALAYGALVVAHRRIVVLEARLVKAEYCLPLNETDDGCFRRYTGQAP